MALSKARKAELEAELLKTMDRLDELKIELREAQRENRDQVKLHQRKLQELRDILSGREGEQLTIGGAEVGEVRPAKASRAAPKGEAAREAHAGLIRWGQPDPDGVILGRHGRDLHKITPYPNGGFRWECPGGGGASPAGSTLEHAKACCESRAEYREKDREVVRCGQGCGRRAHRGACKPERLPSQKGMITRWAADARARKVPTFVIEMTGIYKKAGIVAKYGETCVFEKGKPCPKALGDRPSDKALQKALARPATPKAQKAKPTGASSGIQPFTEIPWVEAEGGKHGGQEAQIGATTWRVLEITPTRWVLESKSQRERAWHKEAVLGSLQEAEDVVRVKADMTALRKAVATTAEPCGACGVSSDQPSEGCEECAHAPGEPLDDLVGTREDAVKRHAAGNSVAR